jgi:hypothetical protein
MSKEVVVVGATIKCSHGGQAQLLKGDNRLQISSKSVVTAGQEAGISFVTTCPFKTSSTPPVPSPCTTTMAGISTLLKVGSTGVLFKDATGKVTNANDPSATWTVSDAGQSLITIDH